MCKQQSVPIGINRNGYWSKFTIQLNNVIVKNEELDLGKNNKQNLPDLRASKAFSAVVHFGSFPLIGCDGSLT